MVAAKFEYQQNYNTKGTNNINQLKTMNSQKKLISLIRNHFKKILFPSFINRRFTKFLFTDILGFYIFYSHKRKKKFRYLFNHNCRKPR